MPDRHKSPSCSNCSYRFGPADNYCPVCGQKNHELRVPLKHLLEEVLETTLHFDSKTVRTVRFLILKPGFLSREFNRGRRVDFVPPIRLYVLISFVFFFLLSLVSRGHDENEPAPPQSADGTERGMSVSYGGITSMELKGLSLLQVDSVMAARKVEPTKFTTYMVRQMYKVANHGSAEFSHALMKNISYMMFLLMPVMGAWIYLFNRKRLGYYIEALVASVHFHSFAFLMFTLLLIVSAAAGMELFFILGFLVLPLYLLFMLRRILDQKWLITIGKTAAIMTLYGASLLVMLLITVLVSIVLV